MSISIVTNEDNMAMMARYPDKFFDLAIVDPPYGININMNMGRKKGKAKVHAEKNWDDSIPTLDYFTELMRVSKNQIIWGGNYFPLPLTNSWIFWDKDVPTGVSFSDGELAWTSFDCVLRKAKIPYSGFRGSEGKIHSTQKPVSLYTWVLKQYGGGQVKSILDTHMGSQSSRIAAFNLGYDYYGTEIDIDYFNSGCKRYDNHISQQRLFTPEQVKPTQTTLL